MRQFLFTLLFLASVGIDAENPSWAPIAEDYATVIAEFSQGLKQIGAAAISVNADEGYVEITQDGGPFSKGQQFGLTNVYAAYAKSHDKKAIQGFVASIAKIVAEQKKVDGELQKFETAQKYLMVKLYPGDYTRFSHDQFVYKEDFGSTVSVVCVNTDFGIRPLMKRDIKNWNAAEDAIFDLALKRTQESLTESMDANDLGGGATVYSIADYGNFFVDSAIYFPELYRQLDKGRGIVAGMPSRHIILFMPVGDTVDADLLAFFNLVYYIYNQEEGKTTIELTYLKDGRHYPISPIVQDGKVNFVMAKDVSDLMR